MVDRLVNPTSLGPSAGPFSQAVCANGFAFLAGQVAMDAAHQVLAPGDAFEQTRAVFARIRTVLAQCGADLDDVVSANVLIADRAYYADVNRAWSLELGDLRPARTMMICGLVLEELLVEIQVVARLSAAESTPR